MFLSEYQHFSTQTALSQQKMLITIFQNSQRGKFSKEDV